MSDPLTIFTAINAGFATVQSALNLLKDAKAAGAAIPREQLQDLNEKILNLKDSVLELRSTLQQSQDAIFDLKEQLKGKDKDIQQKIDQILDLRSKYEGMGKEQALRIRAKVGPDFKLRDPYHPTQRHAPEIYYRVIWNDNFSLDFKPLRPRCANDSCAQELLVSEYEDGSGDTVCKKCNCTYSEREPSEVGSFASERLRAYIEELLAADQANT